MKEKKLWTKEQDQVLRSLKQQELINKWSQIVRKMKSKFGKNSRNQKQCRDRYINHLRIKKDQFEWKKEDQEQMIQLHRQYGNKWATIAEKFNGMYFLYQENNLIVTVGDFYIITQNFIKNQFYSRLRKSIRKINKFINDSFRREFKQLKLNLIFKLASIVDGKLKKINDIHPELNGAYGKFLYVLISFTSDNISNILKKIDKEDEFVLKLIRPLVTLEQIFYYFNKKNKRRAKNKKLSSMRFNQEMQNQALQLLQVQNDLNSKIQQISQKGIGQLHELREFQEKYFNCDIQSMKQQKKQVGLKANQQIQNKKDDLKNKNKNSVSQISLKTVKTGKTDELTDQKMKPPIPSNLVYKFQEDVSSLIQEESQIQDILYEQSPRSVSFIVDHWNNMDQSQSSVNWQE